MTRKTKTTTFFALLSFVSVLLVTSCSDNEGEVDSKGQANIGVTDAAVDAENVTGVYLSVNEIQAKSENGIKTVTRFDYPKSFNLIAYQNGDVFALGNGELSAGSYSELRLILEEGSDASYVTFEDESKVAIDVPSGSTSGYKVMGNFDITANSTTDLVVDIDLRKALVITGNSEFKLRPTARLITKNSTGMIKGSLNIGDEDRVVVYAYQKGTFEESETNEPAEGESRFENSINSAVVAEDGSFTLAFMEEGDYEIIVSSYEMDEAEETYEFKSMVNANIWIQGSLVNLVKVESNTTINLTLDLGL